VNSQENDGHAFSLTMIHKDSCPKIFKACPAGPIVPKLGSGPSSHIQPIVLILPIVAIFQFEHSLLMTFKFSVRLPSMPSLQPNCQNVNLLILTFTFDDIQVQGSIPPLADWRNNQVEKSDRHFVVRVDCAHPHTTRISLTFLDENDERPACPIFT
jgi:hypothetical protein